MLVVRQFLVLLFTVTQKHISRKMLKKKLLHSGNDIVFYLCGCTVYPDFLFSIYIRNALNQQLRGYQTSIWPEAHATSQPWSNVVSETLVCHLRRPLFW